MTPEYPYDVYLAGPFFNEEEVAFVDELAALLENIGLKVYNPKEEGGILGDTAPWEKASEIFEEDCRGLRSSKIVLAIIDNFDPGTIWEMGYAYALQKPIVTISNHGYGLNIMLSESSRAHYRFISELKEAMEKFKKQGIIPYKPWEGKIQ
ncbi:MAG: nucleoside 2-deoxyribosyltransferase [Candidatus Dojkabacteria bacterium]|jgi:nucleoside deoxyribosyltransferase